MYQERLRQILIELEQIEQDIIAGTTIDPLMLEGIKEDNTDYLLQVTYRYIADTSEAVETLIDRFNGDYS